MNERIWDLFKQSGIDIGEDQESNIEKFAELIVRECADAIRQDATKFPAGDLTWISAMEESARVVTRHFGVEE